MPTDNENSKQFITTDFGLAIFLFHKGLKFTTDKTNPQRVVFIFHDKKRAGELMVEWFSAREVLKKELA